MKKANDPGGNFFHVAKGILSSGTEMGEPAPTGICVECQIPITFSGPVPCRGCGRNMHTFCRISMVSCRECIAEDPIISPDNKLKEE